MSADAQCGCGAEILFPIFNQDKRFQFLGKFFAFFPECDGGFALKWSKFEIILLISFDNKIDCSIAKIAYPIEKNDRVSRFVDLLSR